MSARMLKAMAVLTVLVVSLTPMWALRTAAGGTDGSNGFANVSRFLDNLATYLMFLAIPLGVLGLIAAGGMMISGNPSGTTLLVQTALGVGVILLSKGILA